MEYQFEVSKILGSINEVYVGKEEKVRQAVLTLLAGGHLLLEDVPGVGKTTLANALAKTMNCDFGRIQFTPDTLPSDITGLSIYNMQTGKFEYSKGAIMHHVILADEINRTSPKTQASLLEAMEEGQVTVDGNVIPLEPPFMVIATQNPVDFLGTYNLPEAQLDRFMLKISLGYPSKESEGKMASNFLKGKHYKEIKPVVDKETILKMQKEVTEVSIHDDLINYIIQIVDATRHTDQLLLGASPRATLALIRASQAEAYMDHRDYVIPDDIREVMNPVICHRLVLSMEAKMSKLQPEDVLKELIRKIPVPIFKNTALVKELGKMHP